MSQPSGPPPIDDGSSGPHGSLRCQHALQLYEDDEHVVETVASFLSEGLANGAPAIVIATLPHRAALVERLHLSMGHAVAEAVASGQLQLLDADETLAAFTIDGVLDEGRFRTLLGGAIDRAHRAWPERTVYAFGEIVDLLYKRGQRDEAVELEAMWNRLASQHRFTLLCGYGMKNFGSARENDYFDRICEAHAGVLPTERFDVGADVAQRFREVARMQQRAQALAHELVQTREAKDQVLAILGHELRNPLAPMLSAVELLTRKGHRTREHAVIARQVRHLHRLVEDLLDAGRLLRGTFELKKRPTALLNVMERAMESVTNLLEPRQRDLELLPPLHTVELMVDLDRMGEAIGHLLRNALQNSTLGSRVKFAASGDATWATLTVEDQGAGIDTELLPRIFEPFVQHPQPIDRARGGLGIGLAITKRIIELHGGQVVAESAGPGKGSRFTAKVPVAGVTAEQGEWAMSHTPRPGLRNRRVLLVDDNVDAAELLAELLSQNGHAAEIAHTADEAMRALTTFQPHLAVLDIGLPDIDGFELAARIRAQSPAIRLISLSGYGDEGTRERSKKAGFEAHFTKPIAVTELLELVKP